MNTAITPIATTATLSIFLHGVAVAALLAVNGPIHPTYAVGQGIEIELVSSTVVSHQHETDVSRKPQVVEEKSKQEVVTEQQDKGKQVNEAKVVVAEILDAEFVAPFDEDKQIKPTVLDSDSLTSVMQSTNASSQQHAILELLHSRIGDNKEYPYLARRQRREGVTTVAFILHPDGTIENTHLISSSHTAALDRAALSAVNGIAPFTVAQDYLEQAKMFKVDIVFNLL